MRLRPGDAFVITDGRGNEAEAILGAGGAYQAQAWSQPGRESSREVSLFAALTKGEKFDWLVEKAVELGVKRIVPVISQHCVVKKSQPARNERWEKIALSAMLQCGGCVLPEISAPLPLAKLPEPAGLPAVVLYEYAAAGLADFSLCRQSNECWLLTGPEGGFSPEEIELLRRRGWHSLWLGPRIFRAETAPVLALAAVLNGSWGKPE